MKNRLIIYRVIANIILVALISSSAQAITETKQQMKSWTYHQDWDKLTNLNYSLARSPLPKRGLYDNLRLDIVCKDNKLQFVLDANSLITSKGSIFDFEYQIDKNSPVTIAMRTYKDSKRRGYTDEQVERIVAEMLAGQSMFIRINTIIRTVLSGLIPLNDAAGPVQHVLADCGVVIPGMKEAQPDYNLADFEREFKTLTPQQQREVLDQIKTLLEGIR